MPSVLLVEDSDDDTELILRELHDSEFTVICARTAMEAAKHLGSKKFDVVLLDLSLPNGAGMELIRFMLSLARGIPVVLITGGADDETVRGLSQSGIKGYISKKSLTREALRAVMLIAGKDDERLTALREEREAVVEKLGELIKHGKELTDPKL